MRYVAGNSRQQNVKLKEIPSYAFKDFSGGTAKRQKKNNGLPGPSRCNNKSMDITILLNLMVQRYCHRALRVHVVT